MICSNCKKEYNFNKDLKKMFPNIKRDLCSLCLLKAFNIIIGCVNKIDIQKYLNRGLKE